MIGLVACSAQKLDRRAPARDLYSSPLFRKSLAYAEQQCETVYVVSAMHELVELDRELAPYDAKLGRGAGGKRDRELWGRRVAGSLIARHGRDTFYVFLAGTDYVQPIATALRTCDGFRDGPDGPDGARWRGVDPAHLLEPLKGMQVGERLAWLNAQIRSAA